MYHDMTQGFSIFAMQFNKNCFQTIVKANKHPKQE